MGRSPPNYQCSIGEEKILKAISHFSPFTLENAVMLHFKPTLTGKTSTGYNVTLKYLEWDSSELSMFQQKDVRYEASYQGKVLVSTTSLNKLAKAQGITDTAVRKYLNLEPKQNC